MKTAIKLNSRKRHAGPKPPPEPLRLDIGCGPNKKQGFKGIDQYDFTGVDVVCNLTEPWPFDDSSVDEIHASHVIEHFDRIQRTHVVNEIYRVLKPGCKCTLIAPHWSSCRAYGDPTHLWPPVGEFWFFYLKRDWRMGNAPHSDVSRWKEGFSCNFDVSWGYNLEPGVAARNQEYQQHAMAHFKEACLDVIATLTAIK